MKWYPFVCLCFPLQTAHTFVGKSPKDFAASWILLYTVFVSSQYTFLFVCESLNNRFVSSDNFLPRDASAIFFRVSSDMVLFFAASLIFFLVSSENVLPFAASLIFALVSSGIFLPLRDNPLFSLVSLLGITPAAPDSPPVLIL